MRINLSGLQGLDIPTSVFDEFIEKSQHFGKAMYPNGNQVWCDVVWEKDNPYQTPEEPALAVQLSNCVIGYIPCLSTIRRYLAEQESRGLKARANNDLKGLESAGAEWKKQNGRLQAAEIVREYCERELFVEKRPCPVELARVQIADDTGKILSISIDITEE